MFPILNPPPSSLPIPSLWVVPEDTGQKVCSQEEEEMSGSHRHGSILTVGAVGCLRETDSGSGRESTVDVIRLHKDGAHFGYCY